MNYEVKENYIEVKGVSELSLKDTLSCGQCFRAKENEDGSFSLVAYKKKLTVALQQDAFILYTDEEDFLNIWADYFDLKTDYSKIKRSLSARHPVLKQAASFAPGIRILKQESFEALISFIISQNNNIKRISGIVERLCALCKNEIEEGVYAFPDAYTLSKMTVEDLAPIRAGFRAKYIIDAAQKVADNEVNLEEIKDMDIENARACLMKIKGVGVKVADCTLLYGMHRLESFPVDVWMKRAMKVLFSEVDYKDFGKHAGIAQQYIFYFARMHPELFEEK